MNIKIKDINFFFECLRFPNFIFNFVNRKKCPLKGQKIDCFMEMKDRIKQLMETQHLSQQSFADLLGISASTLSNILLEKTKPTLNHVEAIRSKFPSISIEWLLFGQGPMFVNGKPAGDMPPQTPPTPKPKELTLDFSAPSTPVQENTSSHRPAYTEPQLEPQTIVKYVDRKPRSITEIRVFYDDQTWETFVPKK